MHNPHSGDGWAAGPSGIRVWGKFGAAGLFLVAGREVLLQHRSAWTNHGNTWGIPGGARDLQESPTQAALRETHEECAIAPADVEVLDTQVTAGPYPPAGDLPAPLGPRKPVTTPGFTWKVRSSTARTDP